MNKHPDILLIQFSLCQYYYKFFGDVLEAVEKRNYQSTFLIGKIIQI